MKFLVFPPYYPPHIGGVEAHADEFNKYLSQKGMDISVFTPRLPVSAPELETRHNGVKIIRFPAFEIVSNYPLPRFWSPKFWRLFSQIFEENFFAVVSHTRFFSTSFLAYIYRTFKGTPLIHFEHGSSFVKSGNIIIRFVAYLYDSIIGKIILRKTNILIAVSRAAQKFSQKVAPNRECFVVYRGFDEKIIEAISPNEKTREKYKDKIILTFVGRLISGKGISELIEIIQELKQKYPIIFFIVGDGPQRNFLEEKTKKLNLKDFVVFWGYQKFIDNISLLKISDIFINPSYTEGLPTTVAEAALCQKAIIATDVGGTSEIITGGKSGYLVKPGDINSLREKIALFIQNKNLREQFGKQAYESVKSKFNWEKSISEFLRILSFVNNAKKIIYVSAPRSGGPLKQWELVGKELKKSGFRVDFSNNFCKWIRLHFIYGKKRIIITSVPLLFRFSRNNFIFNPKGNYRKERNILKNPLGYLYDLNKLWSEKIVLPSQYLKDILKIENAIIIPNAVSEKLIAESQREKPINDSHQINLIMVTMFGFREKAEGVLKVIECLSKVKTDKKVDLNIFGSGIFENEMRERAEKIKLPENIKVFFRGYTKNIEEEYRKADIFVYWSDLDVMPNVFLEAMAFGLPIVINDFPSFKEIVGNENFVSKDNDEFSKNIESLIQDTNKIAIIGQKNKAAVKIYGIQNILSAWKNIIEK